MNQILGTIDWGAVAVDGFIPPAAFMEFQAYKVLVIACDMRQIHHIDTRPRPISCTRRPDMPRLLSIASTRIICSVSVKWARKQCNRAGISNFTRRSGISRF